MKNGRKTTQLERIEIAEWVIVNDMDYTGATKQYDISWKYLAIIGEYLP
ncbi:hypothetical protein FHQ08_12855 [Lactobacillus sp. CC-MHH1034]|nr:hypothetical protein [Agrilactobacillus fermenti]MCD2257564.1 hypothetical protein [Agrilactobacillus fermenti]